MNRRNILLTSLLFLAALVLISCAGGGGQPSNSSNTQTSYTANRIDATKESLNNMKANANQRAAAIDALASGNSNNSNSY